METTPDVSERSLPKPLNTLNTLGETDKFNKNLKAFDRMAIPEETKQMMENRKTVTYTPGMNKRRLNREENKTFQSKQSGRVHIEPLPEISLTKPRQRPSLKIEKEEDGGRKPLDFLKQFGTTPVKDNPKKEKEDPFKIPEFRPKKAEGLDMKMEVKSKSSAVQFRFFPPPAEKTQKESTTQSMKDIGLRKAGGVKKKSESEEPEPNNLLKPTNIGKDEPKEVKPKTKKSRTRRLYGKTKHKILSVIQEENK
jgi:hypothetical protein